MAITSSAGQHATSGRAGCDTALPTPERLRSGIAADRATTRLIRAARMQLRTVLSGHDDRLVVIVGPCSVHDPLATLHYARLLRHAADELADDLLIVMRCHIEKPRTALGWTGMVCDPHLTGEPDIAAGLRRARTLLMAVGVLGMPVACEWVNPLTPAWLADLVAWGAIGARTVESPVHRHLAAGLDMPIGFKNRLDGAITPAVDAVSTAAAAHDNLTINEAGNPVHRRAAGNPYCHLVLRGGNGGPNHRPAAVAAAAAALRERGLPSNVLVDAAHGNSGKDPAQQAQVVGEIAGQLHRPDYPVLGVMIESFLVEGRQDPPRGGAGLRYGQSITDACLGWEQTQQLLGQLAGAARHRRRTAQAWRVASA